MNPFDKYTEFRLNEFLINRENLEVHIEDARSKNQNFYEALLFIKELLSESDVLRVKTSGSTGTPKELEFPKTAFEISAKATNAYFGLNAHSNSALFLPMQFIAAKMMVIRAIVGNYNLMVHEPTSSPVVKELVDFVPLTPHQMRFVLDSNQVPKAKILLGGSPVNESLIDEILQKELNVFSSFGMTETLSHIALAKIEESSKEGVIYKPLEGIQTGVDVRGCLLIQWKGITDGVLKTNDIITVTNTGFKWLGRLDNLINSGGIKVIPERVEALLLNQIDRAFFVHGMPHKDLGQEVSLFIEGNSELRLSEIEWDFPQQKPRRIIALDKFERTVSGKIQRAKTAAKIG